MRKRKAPNLYKRFGAFFLMTRVNSLYRLFVLINLFFQRLTRFKYDHSARRKRHRFPGPRISPFTGVSLANRKVTESRKRNIFTLHKSGRQCVENHFQCLFSVLQGNPVFLTEHLDQFCFVHVPFHFGLYNHTADFYI